MLPKYFSLQRCGIDISSPIGDPPSCQPTRGRHGEAEDELFVCYLGAGVGLSVGLIWCPPLFLSRGYGNVQ